MRRQSMDFSVNLKKRILFIMHAKSKIIPSVHAFDEKLYKLI